MFLSSSKLETLLLNNRKGFIRLALEQGVDIVPVSLLRFAFFQTKMTWFLDVIISQTYCFGNSRVLKLAPFVAPLEWLSRTLKASIMVFYGR